MLRTDVERAKARAYRSGRRQHYAKLNRDWIIANRARYNASKARYRIKLKREVMELYAIPVQCSMCGFRKLDGLVLDHINNDGAQHRREAKLSHRGGGAGTTIYELIRRVGKLPGLQVLCANCNTIKHLRASRKKTIKDEALLAEIEAYANPPAG